MRGLGVGIIVTAILMGIGNNDVKADKNDSASSAVLSDLQDLSDDAKALEEEMKSSSAAKANNETENVASSSSSSKEATSSSSSSSSVANTASTSSSTTSDLVNSTDKEVAANDAKASSSVVLPEAISILPKAGEISDDGQAIANKAADKDEKKTSDIKEASDSKAKTAEKETADNKNTDTVKETSKDTKDTPENTKEKSDNKEAAKEEKVVENIDITVTSGQSSLSIAKACQAAGLVEDAVAFDNYMSGYGYDRKLTTGKHSIPKGSTEAQIAAILTGK